MKVTKAIKIVSILFLFVMAYGVGHAWADMEITALSSRPDMVSGGDVLIKIEVPDAVSSDKVIVTLNGEDVTSLFNSGSGHFLVGLVDGLELGKNKIKAKAGSSSASLTVVNYPITGPIFSGPHEAPFICETAQAGLGEPLDCDCSIETRVEYYYMSTSGKFSAMSDPKKYPEDLATTTVLGGKTVPYVVRIETGTINRGIYQIAILDDPAKAGSDAYETNDGWNKRLEMAFGGGCGIGHYQGSVHASEFINYSALSRGYALATSSLLTYGTTGNDVLSAETAMMLKEHFIEHYGVRRCKDHVWNRSQDRLRIQTAFKHRSAIRTCGPEQGNHIS